MTNYRTKILSTGKYLPKKVVTNFDLEKTLDTSDEWIFERTGIKERRIASTEGGEFPSDMALHATQQALKNAKMDANDIDMILFASVTPDMPLPNSASILQTKLGITNHCACLDISAACSGFVYGMTLADSLIKTGVQKTVLVVASEMLSTVTNWEDRTSCILFGDGCGAVILGRTPDGEDSDILSTNLTADGTGKDYFDQPIGGAVQPISVEDLANKTHHMHMHGQGMFKVATRTLAQNAKVVLEKADLGLDDVDWLIPHQANVRIIDTTVNMLKMDREKVVVNIRNYGNTSAATIPIALHEWIENGKIKRGQVLVLDAFGAGLTSGALVLRY